MSSSSLGSVVIAIKAVDEASGVMGKIQASMSLVGGQLSQLGGGFAQVGGVIQGFAAGGVAGAAVVAVGEIAKGLQDCIREATSSEAIFASLGAAVTRSGVAWDTVSAATKNALLAMQKTTTYSDEELAAALERLMTFGLSYDDAMKALGKTLDFASAKHMALESAATLVGKAMDGNTTILKRYGVDIATSKDAAAALTAAHDAAAKAIKAMGAGVDAWVTSVTAAIGADSAFESGLAGAKDKAQYLIDQFKQGNIDLPQFTQAMISLGVPLDEAKMKGGTAAEVLAKLNEQFGGAAQAAASTYAGIQERLKNATSEVGEKIGTIFLPALASMTEAMIPIVDSFGKGIDAISSWLTEVGKMPEVQGIVTAVGEAFGGFMKYLQDLWGFIVEQFSPVLTELMGAFKELWDALSPIGEAISEIMAAFGDAGDVDLLKIAVQAIVLEIKGLVEIIKIVVPVIKTFADAFKAAADFITPILKQVGDGIRTFLDDLKTAFQGFYNWLVGGSLWVDLWNKMLSIASNVIGQLIGALSSSLFGPLQSAFEAGISAVAALWDAGWQGVQGTFETVIGAIQTSVNTNFDAIKNYVQTSTGEYAPIATEALNGMEAAVNAGLDLIHGDWKGALDELNTMLTSFGAAAQDTIGLIFTNLEGVLTSGIAGMKSLWDGFVSGLSSAIQKIGQAFGWVANAIAGGSAQASSTTSDAMSTVTDAITGAIEGAQAVTQDGMNAVTGAFSSAFDTVSNAASGFWNWLVGGSIWPEGMDQIAQSTLAGMDVVVSVLSERLTTMMVLIEEGLTSVANSWYDTFTYLVSVTDGAMSAVVGRMQWAVNEIKRLAKELQDAMVTHSIWPDMLSEMQSQTYAALGNIVGAFNGMTLAIPATLPYTAATSSTPTAAPPTRSSEQSFAAQQSITIPITVTLDGEVIRRQVEQRIVRTVLNRGKKVA